MRRQIYYPTRIVILLALSAAEGSELREPKDLSFQCPNDLPLAHPSPAHCVPTLPSNLLSERPTRIRVPPPTSSLRPSEVLHQSLACPERRRRDTCHQSLTLLFATDPGNRLLSPFIATLPKTCSCKSFVCHTSETPRGVFAPRLPASALFRPGACSTRPPQNKRSTTARYEPAASWKCKTIVN